MMMKLPILVCAAAEKTRKLVYSTVRNQELKPISRVETEMFPLAEEVSSE